MSMLRGQSLGPGVNVGDVKYLCTGGKCVWSESDKWCGVSL